MLSVCDTEGKVKNLTGRCLADVLSQHLPGGNDENKKNTSVRITGGLAKI
jgi:hypothetical protein